MPDYSYRITRDEISSYENIVSISSLVVREDFDKNGQPTKIHFHGLMFHEKKIETVRKLFLGHGFKGNGDYQLKVCEDKEKTIRYFSKGKSENNVPVPIVNREKINIKEQHEKYWAKYKELKKLNNKPKTKSVSLHYWDTLEEKIKKLETFHKKNICKLIIEMQYKGNKCLMSKFQMEGIIDYLLMRYLIEVKEISIDEASSLLATEKYGYNGEPHHLQHCGCYDD